MAFVDWKVYFAELLGLMNNWQDQEVNKDNVTTLYLYILRSSCYRKLAYRMVMGKTHWKNNIFTIIRQYLISNNVEFSQFQLEVQGLFGQDALKKIGINCNPASSPSRSYRYPMNVGNVVKWFDLLQKQYSILWDRFVDSEGKVKDEESTLEEDIINAMNALGIIYDLVHTNLIQKTFSAIEGLSDLSLLQWKDKFSGGYHDMDDITSKQKTPDRLDRFFKTPVPPFWAAGHLHDRYLTSSTKVQAQLVTVSGNEAVKAEECKKILCHLEACSKEDPSYSDAHEWMKERLALPSAPQPSVHEPSVASVAQPPTAPPHQTERSVDRIRTYHANQHAEAMLMGSLWRSQFEGFGSEVTVTSSHRYCYCCFKLAELLNSASREAQPPGPTITFPGTHGMIYGWAPPPGLPNTVLERLRDDLYEVLKAVVKRDWSSAMSSIWGEDLPLGMPVGLPKYFVNTNAIEASSTPWTSPPFPIFIPILAPTSPLEGREQQQGQQREEEYHHVTPRARVSRVSVADTEEECVGPATRHMFPSPPVQVVASGSGEEVVHAEVEGVEGAVPPNEHAAEERGKAAPPPIQPSAMSMAKAPAPTFNFLTEQRLGEAKPDHQEDPASTSIESAPLPPPVPASVSFLAPSVASSKPHQQTSPVPGEDEGEVYTGATHVIESSIGAGNASADARTVKDKEARGSGGNRDEDSGVVQDNVVENPRLSTVHTEGAPAVVVEGAGESAKKKTWGRAKWTSIRSAFLAPVAGPLFLKDEDQQKDIHPPIAVADTNTEAVAATATPNSTPSVTPHKQGVFSRLFRRGKERRGSVGSASNARFQREPPPDPILPAQYAESDTAAAATANTNVVNEGVAPSSPVGYVGKTRPRSPTAQPFRTGWHCPQRLTGVAGSDQAPHSRSSAGRQLKRYHFGSNAGRTQ